MGEVKLLGAWGSPFSKRVEIALTLKGVKYEYIEIDPYNNKTPLLLESNPVHKKVPVLIHNGNPIAESLIILEYIDDTWDGLAPPLLPKDPYQRAKARFWAKFIDDKCMPAMWKAYWSRGEERQKAYEEAIEALQILEKEINGKKFFGGDNVGLVDISADFLAHWSKVLADLFEIEFLSQHKFPNLSKWADDFCDCSFVNKNLPPKERLFGHFKNILNMGIMLPIIPK